MVKHGLFDWIITCVSLAVCVLAVFYRREQTWLIALSGGLAAIFFVLGCISRKTRFMIKPKHKIDMSAMPGVRQLMLLNEDDSVLFYIPPATQEMNPAEQIRKEIRKLGFKNESFASI